MQSTVSGSDSGMDLIVQQQGCEDTTEITGARFEYFYGRLSSRQKLVRRDCKPCRTKPVFYVLLVPRHVGRSDLIIRNVGRNVVARHDVLHTPRIPVDIVAIAFARVADPLGIVLVELPLIIG